MHYAIAGEGGFMKLQVLLVASAISLCWTAPAAAADPAIAADAKAFGTRASAEAVDISPSGNKLVMIDPGPGKSSIVSIVDVASGQVKPILKSSADPEKIYWCKFATDNQLICQYGGGTYYDSDLVGFSRLILMDVEGRNVRQLGQPSHHYEEGIRQWDGGVLDWLPDDPGSVLLARTYLREVGTTGSRFNDSRQGLGVDRIDLGTLKAQTVETPKQFASNYLTDGRGNVRIVGFISASSDQLSGIVSWKYRTAKSKEWIPLGDFDSRDDSGIYPLAVDAGCDCVYVLRKTNGRDALYTIKLDGSMSAKLVASNPSVDIDGIERLGRGQKVIGYKFTDDRGRIVYFDPEFDKLATSLGKALPNQPLINFEEASADGSKLLIIARGDADPGTYYYFDRTTRHLDEVGAVRPALQGRPLAHVQTISVTAPDGAQIPAYLTLPAGRSAKNLPAVVLPHGGPSARDDWGFDWLAQFLAARGYAVIQPNYRGSAGYGDEWKGKNGFKDWRQAISDVSASGRYLVAQGIADPQRLAIVGWSYGGYASLQSAAVEPTLYKAAVAIAPVTDLALLKTESEHFTNYELVKDFVGTGPHVIEGSPLRQVSRIKIPVLLFHGDMDRNVDIEQSEKMAAALRGAGDRVDFVRFKGLDHQLDDSNARIEMLTRIGEFLDSAIGH
jgi:dipeptidyl aminopeptidase/acylaminoacyl peptidase